MTEVATGREIPIASDPADEADPCWTPDGKALAFSSTRNGERGVFIVEFRDGQASSPRLVVPLGRATIAPLGFTGDGTLYLQVVRKWHDVVMSTIGLAAATVTPPVRVHRGSMYDSNGAAWSPDGASLAYVAGPIGEVSGAKKSRLIVRNLQSDAVRELPLGGVVTGTTSALWLHDGRLAASYSIGNLRVVDAVDRRTESRSRVFEGDGIQAVYADRYRPALFYRKRTPDVVGGALSIHRFDLRTRESTVVYGADSGPAIATQAAAAGFDISEDGDVALLVNAPGGGTAIRIIRLDGTHTDHGRLRSCTSVAWAGRHVLAGCLGPSRRASLWIVDPARGSLSEVPVDTDLIGKISVRPDGHTIAYTAGNPQPEYVRVRTGLGR